MSNELPDRVEQALNNYVSAIDYQQRASGGLIQVAAEKRTEARKALEAAIDEAITRGKAEPAPVEAAVITEGELTGGLKRAEELVNNFEQALIAYERHSTSASNKARTDAKWTLIREFADACADADTLATERADAINRYNSADAERVNLEMHLKQAHAEHAQAARDRDEFARMYAAACEAGAKQLAEIDNLRAEIASLEQTLASCDSLKLAEELEAMRASRALDTATIDAAVNLCNWHKTTGREISERFISVSGWLDVLADGYLRAETIPESARRLAERLRYCAGAMDKALYVARGEA